MCFSLGLSFLDLIDYFLSHVGEVFNYNFFKNFLSAFLSSSSGTAMTQTLVHLILAQRSLRLSSILFILFLLFCSSAVICTILSYSSLLCSSASVILLLVPSRVFLISVLVLFISVCVFFISSMSLVIVLTVLNVSSFSPFYFQVLGASLPSLFSILFQIDRLFPLCLFGIVHFYFVLSFVLYFSVFSFFPLTFSTWGLLFLGLKVVVLRPPPAPTLGGKGWSSGLCCFLVRGDLCLCSDFSELSLSPWMPGIFCCHLEVASQELFHILMSFLCICGEAGNVSILLLCHFLPTQ